MCLKVYKLSSSFIRCDVFISLLFTVLFIILFSEHWFMPTLGFHVFITYGAKLLSADWLRQRAFFLNQGGSFGNQEGMVT